MAKRSFHNFKRKNDFAVLNYFRCGVPTGSPVIIVHGFLEHAMNYFQLADAICEHKHLVYGLDLRGHGKSGGIRGHVDQFSEFIDDLDAFIDHVLHNSSHKKVTLLGHSMGGLITTYVATLRPQSIEKLVLLSPCFGFPTPYKKIIAKPVGKLATYVPRLMIPGLLNVSDLTHDNEMRTHIALDPLRQTKASIRFLYEFYQATRRSNYLGDQVKMPIHIFQAGDDRIVDRKKVTRFFSRIPSSDKFYVEYPGLFHELINESNRAQIIQEVANVF